MEGARYVLKKETTIQPMVMTAGPPVVRPYAKRVAAKEANIGNQARELVHVAGRKGDIEDHEIFTAAGNDRDDGK